MQPFHESMDLDVKQAPLTSPRTLHRKLLHANTYVCMAWHHMQMAVQALLAWATKAGVNSGFSM